jgi:hypothetical protein
VLSRQNHIHSKVPVTNRQQICRPNQRELRPEIRSSRKKRVKCSEGTQLSVVSADGIGLEAESHGPHRAGKRLPTPKLKPIVSSYYHFGEL